MDLELRYNPLVGFCDPMGGNREEGKRTETSNMENLSLEPNRLSRDLLQRFMGSSSNNSSSSSNSSLRQREFLKREVEEMEEEGDLELSLGLSLGGRFGVDKSKLIRSSSIAACLPIVRDDDAVAAPATVYPSLVRTSSLPVETEEWRKRKEMQSLRRMEAKRRRSEKQRNLKGERDGGSGGSGGGGGGEGGGGSSGGGLEEEKKETEVNWRQRLEVFAAKRFGPSPCRLNSVSSLSRQGSGIDWGIGKGKMSHVGGHLLSQGSIESQGGRSSLESNALPGTSSGSDLSPASIQSLQEGTNQDASSSGLRIRANTSRQTRADSGNIPRGIDTRKRGKEPGKNEMGDMPCVFTKGEGPNARRVDGILYKYGKGEEVRIMCVCHGDFLSPAEFVKHAGGSDVAHPLKHIVINPNPPSL